MFVGPSLKLVLVCYLCYFSYFLAILDAQEWLPNMTRIRHECGPTSEPHTSIAEFILEVVETLVEVGSVQIDIQKRLPFQRVYMKNDKALWGAAMCYYDELTMNNYKQCLYCLSSISDDILFRICPKIPLYGSNLVANCYIWYTTIAPNFCINIPAPIP